jgi:hypothetical protein
MNIALLAWNAYLASTLMRLVEMSVTTQRLPALSNTPAA